MRRAREPPVNNPAHTENYHVLSLHNLVNRNDYGHIVNVELAKCSYICIIHDT